MSIIKVEDAESQQVLQQLMDGLEHIKETVLAAKDAKEVVLSTFDKSDDQDLKVTGRDAEMVILGMRLIAQLIDVVSIERISEVEPHLCSMCAHPQVDVLSDDVEGRAKAWCPSCDHYDYYNK